MTVATTHDSVSMKQNVRERPILFSGPMVRAVLEGLKSQTRRVVKVDCAGGRVHVIPPAGVAKNGFLPNSDEAPLYEWRDGKDVMAVRLCPYGKPGDRLWVRESFQVYHECEIGLSVLRPTGRTDRDGVVKYMADSKETQADRDAHGSLTWRPSIHMPRWASRLSLEITAVRVERLQDMPPEDYEAEGCVSDYAMCELDARYSSLRRQYRELWDSLNAKRGFGWDVNPWVWVISFKRASNGR